MRPFLLTAVVFSLAVSNVRAVDPDAETLRRLTDRLERAIADLSSTEKSLKDLSREQSKRLEEQTRRLDEMQDQVRMLRDDMSRMKDEARAMPKGPGSTSLRLDSDSMTPRNGRVRLQNDYLTEMSVVLNGLSYRLLPGEQRYVEVTPGTYTYRVPAVDGLTRTRTVAAGGVGYVRIYAE